MNEMALRYERADVAALGGGKWRIFKFFESAARKAYASLSFQTSFPPEIPLNFQKEPSPVRD
jgi:hypothetical protein